MKLGRFAFRSINTNFLLQSYRVNISRSLSTNPNSGNENKINQGNNEPADEFERRIFEGGHGNSSEMGSFFRQLGKLESNKRGQSDSSYLNKMGENVHTTLADGMQGRLKDVAMIFDDYNEKKKTSFFEVAPDEVDKEDYAFRPDVSFKQGMTYEVKDLDLSKPGVRKTRRRDFEITTKQVLEEADFRNVKFLSQFITEAGIIIKRSMSGISAKAQRKVAREIKTARAFGLLPFTTMGTKSFVFGKTMEDLDEDYSYRTNIRGPDDFDTK